MTCQMVAGLLTLSALCAFIGGFALGRWSVLPEERK